MPIKNYTCLLEPLISEISIVASNKLIPKMVKYSMYRNFSNRQVFRYGFEVRQDGFIEIEIIVRRTKGLLRRMIPGTSQLPARQTHKTCTSGGAYLFMCGIYYFQI